MAEEEHSSLGVLWPECLALKEGRERKQLLIFAISPGLTLLQKVRFGF